MTQLNSYTNVIDSEVKEYGLTIAYVLTKMHSLCLNNPDEEGYCNFTHTFAIEVFGIVQHQTQWARVIKQMKQLGLITVKTKSTPTGRYNFYKLTEKVLSNPMRKRITESKEQGLPTFSKAEKVVKKAKSQAITKSQTPFQNTPDMKAPESPAFIPEAPTSPVQAVMKREVIAEGIYSTTDNGSSVYVVSNGRDVPKMVDARFKSLLATTCQELGVSPDISIVRY